MPRVLWPLLHHRPIVEVVLTVTSGGQPLVRQLIADTGAATAQAGCGSGIPLRPDSRPGHDHGGDW